MSNEKEHFNSVVYHYCRIQNIMVWNYIGQSTRPNINMVGLKILHIFLYGTTHDNQEFRLVVGQAIAVK